MTEVPMQECCECGVHDFEEFMKQNLETEEWFCKECWHPEPNPDLMDFMDQKRGDR